jgi:hypothetical protein
MRLALDGRAARGVRQRTPATASLIEEPQVSILRSKLPKNRRCVLPRSL